MSYYFSKMLPVSFDEAVRRTTEALKSEGFGGLTEIDVKQTLKLIFYSTNLQVIERAA